jgi:hypothetical protein
VGDSNAGGRAEGAGLRRMLWLSNRRHDVMADLILLPHCMHTIRYVEARETMVTQFCGVGRKVADCICLIGLEHYGAIPVDTHCWQFAARYNYISAKLRGGNLNVQAHDAIAAA